MAWYDYKNTQEEELKMNRNISQLINHGKSGDCLVSRGGFGFSSYRFFYSKTSSKRVNLYKFAAWRDTPEAISAMATLDKEGIVVTMPKDVNSWGAGENISAIVSLSLVPYLSVRRLRGKLLISTQNGEFRPYVNMKFSWNGELISKVPKSVEKEKEEIYEQDRQIRNRMSRARYADKAAMKRYNEAKESDNWDNIPIDDVFKHRNAQIRAYLLEKIGLENALKPYKTKVIDSDLIDGRPYELLEIDLPDLSTQTVWEDGKQVFKTNDTRKCLYLKMTNPSTGEYHLEGVPRESDFQGWGRQRQDWIAEDTVKASLAWRDGIPADEYINIGYEAPVILK